MENLLKLLALFLTLFFGFMFVLRIYATVRSKRMQGQSFDLIDRGVVYFYSERCGACKLMKPVIEKLEEKTKVLYVDVGKPEGFKTAQQYGIMATPTTLVVRDGIIKRSFVGVVRAGRILQELEG